LQKVCILNSKSLAIKGTEKRPFNPEHAYCLLEICISVLSTEPIFLYLLGQRKVFSRDDVMWFINVGSVITDFNSLLF